MKYVIALIMTLLVTPAVSGTLDYKVIPSPVVVPNLQCLEQSLLWKVLHGCFGQRAAPGFGQEDTDDRRTPVDLPEKPRNDPKEDPKEDPKGDPGDHDSDDDDKSDKDDNDSDEDSDDDDDSEDESDDENHSEEEEDDDED